MGVSLLIPGLTVDVCVNLLIALNAWSTYPIIIVVLQVNHAHGFIVANYSSDKSCTTFGHEEGVMCGVICDCMGPSLEMGRYI